MKTIHRIFIENQVGNCGDLAYKFVKTVLKRRYGNGVTFALSEEKEKILSKLINAGFNCKLDGFKWDLYEPTDYIVNNIIKLTNDFNMSTAFKVMEISEDIKHGKIAKVKQVDRPRKKAVWIKIPTKESFLNQLKKDLDPYDAGLNIAAILNSNE